MGERIQAKDETKREILWWINTEVGMQVRQGKGNRIKERKEGRSSVRGQEKIYISKKIDFASTRI